MTATRRLFFVDLDAAHPSLDHHRPGGAPLFGTAMGIDALAAAARQAARNLAIVAIERIEIHHPGILAEGEKRRLTVEFDARSEGRQGPLLSGRIVTPAGAAPEILHVRACFRLGRSMPPSLGPASTPHRWAGAAVTARDIYGVYFHGPAFQVIAGAAFLGDALIAALAPPPRAAEIPAMARLIEFGLQTSGLLALARTGGMLIPHRIGRIVVPQSLFADDAAPVVAVATPGATDTGKPATDIEILDAANAVLIRIEGYETVPLPFASDLTAAAALGGLLRANGRVAAAGRRR
jgi:hypothetical protein